METALQAHVISGKVYKGTDVRAPAPAIVCADGFTVSVQASSTHYSSPRSNMGPYTDFELGYPSEADDLLTEFAETPNAPTETVYGYVPLSVVLSLLAKHGGVPAFAEVAA